MRVNKTMSVRRITTLLLFITLVACSCAHALTVEQMDLFTSHCDEYLGQDNSLVLHPIISDSSLHVDVLLYKPTADLPYWKMVTMGASDYRMPVDDHYPFADQYGDRNEYIIFIDGSEDLENRDICFSYYRYLNMIAYYPPYAECLITYGHSCEWETDVGEEMAGAYLELPMIMEDVEFAFFELEPDHKIVILQPVLLTRAEIDMLLTIGSEQFDYYLYPEDGRPHFLCELKRSDKF